MKKRIMGLLMAFMLANSVLLAGCGSTSSSDDLLAEIQTKGKIVFAMEGQWAPWTYHDESGELVGFDTEVGKAIANKLGVEAEFVEGEWDGWDEYEDDYDWSDWGWFNDDSDEYWDDWDDDSWGSGFWDFWDDDDFDYDYYDDYYYDYDDDKSYRQPFFILTL